MNQSNSTEIITLPLFPCHLLELPDSRIDCFINATSNSSVCVRCPILGRFAAGGALISEGSYGGGRTLSLLEWVLTLIIGSFGTITNSLIIAIILRRETRKAFDLLLVALAAMDLLGSVMAVMASTSTVSFIENWERGIWANYFIYFGTLTCFLARSGSSFMTVMITLERYLMIRFYTRAKAWFTIKNTKIMITVIYIFVIVFLAFPRYTAFKIVPNDFGQDIPSLKSFTYIMISTPMQDILYGTLGGYFSKIDFWVPLPTLLFLNLLVFIEVWKFARKRKQLKMSRKQERDFRAVKMFVPVVVALFVCNIEPYVYYYFVVKEAIAYRDLFLGVFLSVAVNSSVNLPIYYFKGSSFRREVKELLTSSRCCMFLAKRLKSGKGNGEKSQRTTTELSSKTSGENVLSKYSEDSGFA